MAKSCAIIPQVRSNKGQIVDSRLFKDLLSYTGNNRQDAVRLYLTTKNKDFISHWNPKLVLDENNEPTLSSLLKKTTFNKVIPTSKVLDKLNRDIGYYDKTSKPVLHKMTNDSYQEAIDKAIRFNNNSEFNDDYVATVIKSKDDNFNTLIGTKVERRTRENTELAKQMEYNAVLNDRLREILESHGITTGTLTDLENRMSINGVTDFNVAKTSADGLIEMIRLANGIRGEKALPEEFAHFALKALGNSPLVNRLINNLDSTGAVSEILGDEYDTYYNMYKGDTAKLAEEAAGKLLAKHLLNSEVIKPKPYRNLLERVITAIKNFFRNMNASDIQRAIYTADKKFGKLADDILNGNLDNEINLDNINSSDLFYQTNERVNRDKKLLQNIINNELKRLKIYEQRSPNNSFSVNQRLLIDKLELDLDVDQEVEGIYSFIDNALTEMQKVDARLKTLNSAPSTNINKKAAVLRDVRNYMYSYKGILDDIRENLIDEEKYSDNRYGQRVRIVLDNASNLLGDLFIKYNNTAMPLFVDFIKPFIGESIIIPFGKFKGRVIKAEDLIKTADEDISFFDRWLDSMADSSDYMLKIMDQAVKKSKENARLRTIDVMKQLQAATIKLEQAGVKDTAWMFERDEDGNLTGNYISQINKDLFRKRVAEMYKNLESKYGRNPIGEDVEKYNKERKEWYETNTEIVDGKKVPKQSIYDNPVFTNLNEAQKEYYNTVMSIKAKLDSYLPAKYTTLENTVKIRKDLLERIKSSDSVSSGAKQLWESIKDDFIRRTDDTDFGEKAAIQDFEGNRVQSLPIYYTRMKDGESANDLSTDIVSTLAAYAAMANDYDEMNKVIDTLELGRDLLRERKVAQTEGDKSLEERFKSLGRTVKNTLFKKPSSSEFIARLNDFFDMQVYGRYMADEGTFGESKIDKGKVANFVNKVTSLNTLALNILSGISNVATGTVMMRIESFAGEFYNEGNTIVADKNYAKELPAFLAEIGSRVKTNKLALWDELFNVMQEYEQDIREVDFDRKTWFSKMFKSSSLFFMNNAGEHWMQNRTSLALADAYKMKAPNGKIVSLWDAMEVVPIDKNNKKLGAKLQVKEGYTKADGSQFTKDDIIKFSRKSAAINQRMHGIYNKADKSAVQKLAIGRMGIMFRKWIKPSLNRRFSGASYNYDLDGWSEGYYITTRRFLYQLVKDLKNTQFNLTASWKELTPTEKANITRAITEVGHFLGVAMIIGLIEWSDDKDRPWLIRMLEYQSRRLYSELGSMTPGLQSVSEAFRIVKSPAAGINTIENMLGLVHLLNPFDYKDEIQSGRYKGHSTAYKTFFNSPVIPMNKTIYRGLHPEEGIPFFKQ